MGDGRWEKGFFPAQSGAAADIHGGRAIATRDELIYQHVLEIRLQFLSRNRKRSLRIVSEAPVVYVMKLSPLKLSA